MADINEYPPFNIPSLKFLDPVSVHESVVKLSFFSQAPAVGTGFFINIPDSSYEVILTAGYNLYNPRTKTFTTDLKVLFPNPSSDDRQGSPMPIPPEHVKVSAEYLKDTTNEEADYGVILIPYTKKMPRRGLGFKMANAFTELRGEVRISSYRGATTPGRPVISSGLVLVNESTQNQLVYDGKTEQGSGGSPVWCPDGVGVTVVAVHNRGSRDGSGNRGSRISPKLLSDVFTWANLNTTRKTNARKRFMDPASVRDSVVKLSFFSQGPCVGTGFFIHIPDSSYEVILTAAHNLYNPRTKTFTTDVKVLFPNPSSDEGYPMPIPPEHIKVSAEYFKDTTIEEADYGVILIPYTEKMPRRGLGFKMANAFTELRGEVIISSYRGETTPGRPVVSSGLILVNESTENQLVYDALTEQGNSGSPVWFPDDAGITVVAVHNNSKDGSRGSRGSRISPKLLRDVLTWGTKVTGMESESY